jgi:predicted transcriptional regulator
VLLTEKIQRKEPNVNFLKPLFVLERFAVMFREKTEVNKTQLQLQSKLRWNLFNKYLQVLVEKKFLIYRKENRVEIYSMTEQGRKFFSILTILLNCLK